MAVVRKGRNHSNMPTCGKAIFGLCSLCCLQTLDVISLCNVSQQFFQDLVEVISVESFPFAEPASLSRGLQDKAVAAGASVHFWCNAGGSPAPTLTWLHNAAPLRPSPRHFPSGNHLRICGVTLHDSGLYQCVANNGIGFVQSTGRLRVQPGRSTCSPQELTVSIYALSFMLLWFFFPRLCINLFLTANLAQKVLSAGF